VGVIPAPAPSRIAYGDWQTPDDLADQVLVRVAAGIDPPPRTVLEPTCGTGAFLAAAARRLPGAALAGYEIDPRYVAVAASRIQGPRRRVEQADFFSVDWEGEIAGMEAPVLVVGNPPWVTSADLGAMGSTNLPAKRNWKGLRGLDALTGKSNFDVSEWMILRLLAALSGTRATLAMLCKTAVARRVVELCARQGFPVHPGALFRIDAGRHFDAAVSAVLLVCRLSPEAPEGPAAGSASWPVYASLDAGVPETSLDVEEGALVADRAAHARSRALAGRSDPEWRSGLKHDCAGVMELSQQGPGWVNGEGEEVDVEPAFRYPLLKGSDLAGGRLCPARAVLVPQRALGEDTASLCDRAPKLWAYLGRHRERLGGRKSTIYRGKPPFSIFGVGSYSFAPWKVAVSGLHKRLRFAVVGPHGGQPVMLDDTCYFLPFESEPEAARAAAALGSGAAGEFFRGRVFWDAKRPITKAVLQSLDLAALMRLPA
jgi:hypothetical protein